MVTIKAFGLKRDTAEVHRCNVVEMKWICGLFFAYIEKVSEMPFSARLLVLWFLSSARCNITASNPLSRLYLCLLFQCQTFKTSKHCQRVIELGIMGHRVQCQIILTSALIIIFSAQIEMLHLLC